MYFIQPIQCSHWARLTFQAVKTDFSTFRKFDSLSEISAISAVWSAAFMAGVTQSQLNLFLTALNFSGQNSKGSKLKLNFMSWTSIQQRKSVQAEITQISKGDQQQNLDLLLSSESPTVQLQADGCYSQYIDSLRSQTFW